MSHSSAVQPTGKTIHSGTAGAARRMRTTNQNMTPVNRPMIAMLAR